jgi:rhodanese-related sulfurtransferase
MKKVIIPIFVVIFLVFSGTSFAADVSPIPITAEQAFNAVQTQTDPITGEDKTVALVDVRTRAEYFWVGAASQVDEIITIKGESIAPDYGKVLLTRNGRFLRFKINGRHRRLQVKKVSDIFLSTIAINIPFKLWDEATGKLSDNENFATEVEALSSSYNVIITFCRSGGRSEDCLLDFDTGLFDAIYEIDQPDGKTGRGGFEGTSYSNVYNGYRGFPERLTEIQDHPSVSWKDTGLPIITSVNPLAK